MAPEIIVALASSVITAIVGPVVLQIVKNKTTGKKPDTLKKELQLSKIVDEKLLEIQENNGADRVWITQFHNGGYFYPTGKSIQKFSMIYEVCAPGVATIQNNFQNIPINLFNRSINYVMEEDVMCIPDFKDETKPSYGLKYLAQETGCKSAYGFALRTIDGKFVGMLGIDYVKHKKQLTQHQLDEILYVAAALGGLIGDNLK